MDLLSILDGTPEPPIVELQLDEINTSGIYNLQTPMFEFQKELTDQIVSLHYSDILKFCEMNDKTELIVKSLEICVENCMLVATHPYLLIQHYMPKNLTLRDIPAKLAETSGKFNVLRDIINVVVLNKTLHAHRNIGVVLRNDQREFDLTEALVLGCQGSKSIQRYVGNNVKRESAKNQKNASKNPSATTIHLIPHDGVISRNSHELELSRFDALIVMDGYVNTTSDFFKSLRTQNQANDEEAVIIRLIPIYTIEHALLEYIDYQNDPSYLYKLISSIVCLRDRIGNLPPDLFPIYNQNLTYLSQPFFDHVFRRDISSFPAWPLPELLRMPRFSPTDVEESLLTEVVYHYTPYDSMDSTGQVKKKTYYETKRLQLDYVTNPLKNDYNTLSGIHNHDVVTRKAEHRKAILSHKIVLGLNTACHQLSVVEEEYGSHLHFNEDQVKERNGRRLEELNKTLASLVADVDHVEQRIQVTEKKILKRQQETDKLKESIALDKEQVDNFLEKNGIDENSPKGLFVAKQLKVWALQNEVKELAQKLQSKNDEKSYTQKEVENSSESIKQSHEESGSLGEKISDMKRKLESAREDEENLAQSFKKQKVAFVEDYDKEKERNVYLKAKLAKTLKFLKDTSHMKSRKGRGLTPNNR